MRRPAVFLDRDGTIIEDVGYLRDPSEVRLMSGAAEAIHRLNASGLVCVVVTNQSGVARGILSEEDYHRIERRMDELLATSGARIEGHYFCPHLPDVTGPCECRKPGTLLYRQAAQRFDIDLERSWWVGDRPRDVLPATAFNGRGILIVRDTDAHPMKDGEAPAAARVRNLDQAVDLILRLH